MRLGLVLTLILVTSMGIGRVLGVWLHITVGGVSWMVLVLDPVHLILLPVVLLLRKLRLVGRCGMMGVASGLHGRQRRRHGGGWRGVGGRGARGGVVGP